MNRKTSTTNDQTTGKSDRAILPMKRANKISNDVAEHVEGRALTKRNVSEDAGAQAQNWNSTMFRLARVREAVQGNIGNNLWIKWHCPNACLHVLK